jgi:hypothetical protein
VRFELLYRGQRVSVDLSAERLRLRLHPCAAAPIRVAVGETLTTMAAGEAREFALGR